MKYTKKQIEKMKEDIYENIEGAYIDDGMDSDEASDLAREEVNDMTTEEIIKEYEESNATI